MGLKKVDASIRIFQDLIRDGEYKEAQRNLSAKAAAKIPANVSAEIIMELLPVRTRPAKEIVFTIMECSYPSLGAKDATDNTLLRQVVKYERMDVLLIIIRKLNAQKMRQGGESWTEVVCYLLEHGQKVSLEQLLKKNVLKYMMPEKREEIYRGIIQFKDLKLFEYILKYERKIPVEFIDLPQNSAERNFLKNMLNQYAGKVRLSSDTERLWEMGLSCDADKFLRRLLKKKKSYQYLGRLAQGPDPLFRLVLELSPKKILDEVKEEVLLQAFLSDGGMERYEILCKKGWNKSIINKEKLRIGGSARENLNKKQYEKNKRGRQEKLKEQRKWKALEKFEEE